MLQIFERNGQTIRFRPDGWGNLTDMAKATGKQVKHWNENKSTFAYLKALSSAVGIPTTELIEVIQGGVPEDQGTWAHPKVCIRFAQWCSPEFAVWVDMKIDELLRNGVTTLFSAPQTYLEALKVLVATEEEKLRLQEQTTQLEAENRLLEEENEQLAETVDELFDYSSIVRIAKFNGISEKTFAWRKLKAATLNLGLSVKQVPCPRFGHKNLYPHAAWKVVYPDAALPEPTTIRVAS